MILCNSSADSFTPPDKTASPYNLYFPASGILFPLFYANHPSQFQMPQILALLTPLSAHAGGPIIENHQK
jgi:hypothetical protein